MATIGIVAKSILIRDKKAVNFYYIILIVRHLICNKNAVPNDPQKPSVTSGLRVGTPAGTTRGFKEKEFAQVANWIADIIDAVGTDRLQKVIDETKAHVANLCKTFPIYEGGV